MGRKSKDTDTEILSPPSVQIEKKKKKKRKQDSSFSQESEQEDMIVHKSNKKKSKKKKEEQDELPNGHDDTSQASPKKKKKSSHNKVPESKVVRIWGRQEINKLMDVILQNLPPSKTKETYLFQLKHINWENVAKDLDNRLPEECQEAFNAVLHPLSTIKNIQTLVGEAKVFIEQDKNFKRFNFANSYGFKTFSDRSIEEGETIGSASLYQEWKKLSRDDQRHFIAESLNRQEGPKMYKLPIEMMKQMIEAKLSDSKEAKNALVIRNEVNKSYGNLSNEAKLKLLKKSAAQMDKYLEEAEAFKQMMPLWEIPILKYPNKTDIYLYLKEVLDMPEAPPPHPLKLYFSVHDEPDKAAGLISLGKYGVLRNHFNKLPDNIRKKYVDKYNDLWEKYEENINAWKVSLTPAQTMMFNKLPKCNKSFAVGKRKKKKPSAPIRKQWITEKNSLESVKFKNEPKRIDTKPYDIFHKKSTRNFNSEDKKKWVKGWKSHWENLSTERKMLYTTKAVENKEKYKQALLEYVESLSIEKRRLFLGFRRKNIYASFSHDIFEEDYPNTDYPVYEKEIDISKSPKKELIAENNDSSSDDFEEPVKSEPKKADNDHIPKISSPEKKKKSPKKKQKIDSDASSNTMKNTSPKKVKRMIEMDITSSSSDEETISPRKTKPETDQNSSSSELEDNSDIETNPVPTISLKEEIEIGSEFEQSEDDYDIIAPSWKNSSITKQQKSESSDDSSSDDDN